MGNVIAKSNSALARQIGVSETAVRKAEKSGRIKREPDGSWNVAKVRRQWKANTDQSKQRGKTSEKLEPVPQRAVQTVNTALKEDGNALRLHGGSTLVEAKTAHEILKAQSAAIDLQAKKKSLIDRQGVKDDLYKVARQLRDSWLNWPARVSASMAAELGVDQHQMHVALERAVHEHLTEVAKTKIEIRT
ncbi:elements of external origin [Magnetococcales bacterium HHB-1]